jgi:hypothetical protein
LINEVICGEPAAIIELGSRVLTMSFGTWGEETDILALVKEDLPGFVEFFFL